MTTSTSTGYGDLQAQVLGEKVFAIFNMTFGVFLFGYLFGSVASALANSDGRRAFFEEQVNGARRHMIHEEVDPSLTARCLKYLKYIWARKSGTDCANLFQDMPISLQAEVSRAAYSKMLQESHIFNNCDEVSLTWA